MYKYTIIYTLYRNYITQSKNWKKYFSTWDNFFWGQLFSSFLSIRRSSEVWSFTSNWENLRKVVPRNSYSHFYVSFLMKIGHNSDFNPRPPIFKKSKITLKPLLCKKYSTRCSSKVLKFPSRPLNPNLTRFLWVPA